MTNMGMVIMNEKKEKSELGYRSDSKHTRITDPSYVTRV